MKAGILIPYISTIMEADMHRDMQSTAPGGEWHAAVGEKDGYTVVRLRLPSDKLAEFKKIMERTR